MNCVLCFICVLFIIIGFFIGKIKTIKNIDSLIFGFVLLQFIIRCLPISYDLLYINFHKTTLIFVLLLIILGFTVIKLFDLNYDNKCNFGFILYLFLGYVLCGMGLTLYTLIYTFINIIVGIRLTDNKKKWLFLIISIICSMIGCLLFSISNWMIGYILSFLLGVILYYLLSIGLIVIKNKEKSSSIFLLIGMFLSFILMVIK